MFFSCRSPEGRLNFILSLFNAFCENFMNIWWGSCFSSDVILYDIISYITSLTDLNNSKKLQIYHVALYSS